MHVERRWRAKVGLQPAEFHFHYDQSSSPLCLPEDRTWPGTKCERCQHYGYVCSAMRTKHEESSAIPDVSPRNSPSLPTTTPSTSPQARPRRSEIRCLQDLGDLRQLSTSHSCPLLRY
ncbi:hypothetical protein HO173_006959 [Letharia columbiana]|uniref:Uncharacterized protein n=1 Tax=Letharia columbiana TaxID=112416 RepID=A0A8H6FU17_9LECA|nr:uncharacterized protein HO173_006959 [Letharia columbiana]KAF6234739.1 hypothetical protein HO173_006959 [Letharia columbiana]